MESVSFPSAEESLLNVEQVAKRIGVADRTVWRRVNSGEFPQPVHVGRSARWVSSEINGYIETLKQKRNGGTKETI